MGNTFITVEEEQEKITVIHINIETLIEITKTYCANSEIIKDKHLRKIVGKLYESFYRVKYPIDILRKGLSPLKDALMLHISEYNRLFPEKYVEPLTYIDETAAKLENSLGTYTESLYN